ncbi:MAG: metallophosphoesterase family protein [Chitinophagales bacterium]
MRRFAISDIHGCKATFEKMLTEVIQLQKEDTLYLLGDYIDRGPDSKGVFDLIMDLQEKGYQVHCLMGNHEDMLLRSFQSAMTADSWLMAGGDATLHSFGVKHWKDIPQKYFDFMENLQYYFELDDYLLVHAGFNFRYAENLKDLYKDEFAMLWLRYWYDDIKPQLIEGRTIVHGHTPTHHELIEEMLHDDSPLDIDAGCVYEGHGMGHLCALDMDNKTLSFLPYCG